MSRASKSRGSSRPSRAGRAKEADDKEKDIEPEAKVLVIGGLDSEQTHATAEVFSTHGKQFAAGPQLAVPRWGCASVPLPEGRVLIVGGSDGYADQRSTEVLDLAAGTTSPGPDLLEPRSGCTAVRLDEHRVLVIGGYGAETLGCEVLNLETMTCVVGPRLSLQRACCGAVLSETGRIIVAGGFDHAGALDSTEVAELAWAFREDAGPYDLERVRFEPGPQLKHRRGGCAAALLDANRMLIAGGSDGHSRLSSCEVLSLQGMTIASGPRMVEPRSGLAMAKFHRSRLMVAGGLGGGAGAYSDTTEILDMETMAFSSGPSLGSKRAYCAMTHQKAQQAIPEKPASQPEQGSHPRS